MANVGRGGCWCHTDRAPRQVPARARVACWQACSASWAAGVARACEERQADAAALEVASTALPSLMQSLVRATAAATASALMRAACARGRWRASSASRST